MTIERTVAIDAPPDLVLHADLAAPDRATGIVVFAHGSGSSRHSGRNKAVAAHLRHRGVATLLLDLLTVAEERGEQRGGTLRFDVDMLAERLAAAGRWARSQGELAGLPLGYFGASTGAAAALIAAAEHPGEVAAVVSRGGRPDLAGAALRRIECPTLLIVGGDDEVVVDLNRRAATELRGEVALEIVPGATHLFEEPGALDVVAELAGEWFVTHLGSAAEAIPGQSAP